jgi:hypothetical protein
MASFAVPSKRDIIFIFMRPTLSLPASFLPIPQFSYLTPRSRTHNNFTFDVGLRYLPVYRWSCLTET